MLNDPVSCLGFVSITYLIAFMKSISLTAVHSSRFRLDFNALLDLLTIRVVTDAQIGLGMSRGTHAVTDQARSLPQQFLQSLLNAVVGLGMHKYSPGGCGLDDQGLVAMFFVCGDNDGSAVKWVEVAKVVYGGSVEMLGFYECWR